jgi:hypothetical protein
MSLHISSHKQCILICLYVHNSYGFHLNLAVFEPGSCVPEAYAMVTAPRRLVFSQKMCSKFMQGCQMVYIHTKNPNLGVFRGPLNGKCWNIS